MTSIAAVHESAFGTKRTFRRSVPMSAFGGEADMARTSRMSALTRSGHQPDVAQGSPMTYCGSGGRQSSKAQSQDPARINSAKIRACDTNNTGTSDVTM